MTFSADGLDESNARQIEKAALPSPGQCEGRSVTNAGLRYWCIGPAGHGGWCFWDLAPGQPEPEPHDFGGMST